ncbi:hypothetical protein CRG98_045706 [Punica granatum]|uniref:Uncharacterized protein n=1 Tax=Punica granatum TaxID=22663 RepID=A0A2I0HRJ5_PUNGR|nr:hypothetical protein CRG98_045706 [Punica granatum]
MGIQAGAALSCVEEKSSARVSGMRRESGEGGDIRTGTEPIRGGSFRVSRAGLNDRVWVRMSPSSPDFLPMLKTLMWHVCISLPCILVDVHPYVPLSGLISKVFFLDFWWATKTFRRNSFICRIVCMQSPIQPLRLLVPSNYPNCSPVLLDDFHVESDGGSFSSKYRTWENIQTATSLSSFLLRGEHSREVLVVEEFDLVAETKVCHKDSHSGLRNSQPHRSCWCTLPTSSELLRSGSKRLARFQARRRRSKSTPPV